MLMTLWRIPGVATGLLSTTSFAFEDCRHMNTPGRFVLSLRTLLVLAAAAIFLAVSTPTASAQKKELIQLQRDMALLQDSMRQLDRQNAERYAGLEALLKQNLEKQDKLNAALVVIERNVSKQGDSLIGPMNSTSAKVDSLADQFVGLRTAVEETNAMLARIQQEVDDIKTHLTTLPPPSFDEGEEGAVTDGGSVSASEAIYEGGMSDYHRNNLEIARDQFRDYIALYPKHSKAAEAQYYIGQTYYSDAKYEEAAENFDLVVKKYPAEELVLAGALYKKGMALMNLSRGDQAAIAFQAVLDRFPNSSIAPNAQAQLDNLGQSKPSPTR
jgi:tol-pal system protein YbgF